MKILFDGVKEFTSNDFEYNKELFQQLSASQKPHTLFIGCSDSRVVPNLITKTMPGELFVIRNIANIVPFYRESNEYLATTSAIEYAVMALDVKNIIICGHSNCGGCKALYFDESELENIPNTKRWLLLAKDAKSKAEKMIEESNIPLDKDKIVEQANIVLQLNHLLTYPMINDRHHSGKLNIYGWYYEIGSGKIFNYNFKDNTFELIE